MDDHRIGSHLKALGNIMKRYFENASTINYAKSLTGENTYIIHYLAEKEEEGKPVYQKDIEKEFSITRSTTSKVLTLMENKNLIRRTLVPGDKRLKRIVLTDEAKDLHKKIMVEINAFEDTMKQGLSEEEIEQFFSTIETIKHNLEKKDPS
ncbi:MAG: MarR family winged helix-turn-helix transcriptional regulator [Bacillota bacterium]